MNRKKIENWVIFGLKLLPFLMLAIFAVHIHRHDLPESVVVQHGYTLEVGSTDIIYEPQVITPSNVYPYNSWTVLYYIQSTETFENITLFYNEGSPSVNNPNASFINISGNNLEFLTSFKITAIDSGANLIYFNVPAYITYTEPLDIISVSFNNYLSNIMNFNFFNINDFYNWSTSIWFNNEPPLIYKPVFIILIYELLVDLLVLMYSFITFVIKFAQKWLNGIYNKDW